MKINVTKESKRKITMAQQDALKKLITFYKESDDSTPADYARMAARHIFYAYYDIIPEVTVLSATARVDRNPDAVGWIDDSEDLDVLIEFTACDASTPGSCDHMLVASCFVSTICKMDFAPSKNEVWAQYNYRLFDEITSYRD